MKMYHDYEDDNRYEPSEFETEINKLVQQEIENRISDTVSSLESYKNRYEKSQQELSKVRSELYTLKNNSEKQLQQALKDKEREVFTGFTSGFAPHDKIWFIESKRTETTCTHCNGKYKIKVDVLGKVKEVDCPHCSYGKVSHYTYYPMTDTISSIYFNYHRVDRNSKNSGVVLNIEKIYLDKLDYNKSPSQLYKTLEECQKACDEQNKPKS
jgi:uncharacterized Zn-finger protein